MWPNRFPQTIRSIPAGSGLDPRLVLGRGLIAVIGLGVLFAGCSAFQKPALRPAVHNPFPQIHKVAVAPFFNLSAEPTLDGRKVAIAYYNELQEVPGFEVIPVGVVERAVYQNRIALSSAEEARRLARLLGADAVVIGAVTEYSAYYPPRLGLQVEWYAANPGFQPVPPGYGLPWGTDEEEKIPDRLVLESQLAFARDALRSQTPDCPADPANLADEGQSPAKQGLTARQEASPQGLLPHLAASIPGNCQPSAEPILKHTRVYNGGDTEFVHLLREHSQFRDDAALGGWQSYLSKSSEFVRFCCRLHIWEMLTARGGADKSQLVWSHTAVR